MQHAAVAPPKPTIERQLLGIGQDPAERCHFEPSSVVVMRPRTYVFCDNGGGGDGIHENRQPPVTKS